MLQRPSDCHENFWKFFFIINVLLKITAITASDLQFEKTGDLKCVV